MNTGVLIYTAISQETWRPLKNRIGINNISDETYRIHGCGIDGIGSRLHLINKYVY